MCSGLLAIDCDDGKNGWNDDGKQQLYGEIVDFEDENKACNVSS